MSVYSCLPAQQTVVQGEIIQLLAVCDVQVSVSELQLKGDSFHAEDRASGLLVHQTAW
jgi:hypothetical protein